MFTARFQAFVRRNAQRLVGGFTKLGITPNQITVAGLGLTFVAAILVGSGALLAAGLVLAFSASFDVLDGALARASSRMYPYGAFLDSATDRYAESAVYIGLAFYFSQMGPTGRWPLIGSVLALVGSFQVSYVRARAQSLGFSCDSGLFARPERVVAMVAGLVIAGAVPGWGQVLNWVVYGLALLTNLTALQRINEVWQQARAQRRTAARDQAAVRGSGASKSLP